MTLESYDLLDQLPFGVSVCDAEGLVEWRNSAAAALASRSADSDAPGSECCRAIRLYRANGAALTREDYPIAAALRGEPGSRGMEVLVEHPDGSVTEALAFATPRLDERGAVAGAVCVMVDLPDRSPSAGSLRHLAAIVDSTRDAIVSTRPDLTIATWNRGAAQLLGHNGAEVVGRPLEFLVPADRRADEAAAVRRILDQGEAERFDTERVRSDGSKIEVSATVSPILDHRGRVAGISQIVREVDDRQRTLERQELLIAEMNHRVKNLLVLAGGIVSLGARTARSVQALASDVTERFAALARAHELTLPRNRHVAAGAASSLSLHALIETILDPFEVEDDDGTRRIAISGDDTRISAGTPLTGMALLLHEFATNAAKHGALARPSGRIHIHSIVADGRIAVTWTESGGPAVTASDQKAGFGSKLIDLTVRRQLSAELTREWQPDGLVIRLSVSQDRLTTSHS